jgi:hypothetical protein
MKSDPGTSLSRISDDMGIQKVRDPDPTELNLGSSTWGDHSTFAKQEGLGVGIQNRPDQTL